MSRKRYIKTHWVKGEDGDVSSCLWRICKKKEKTQRAVCKVSFLLWSSMSHYIIRRRGDSCFKGFFINKHFHPLSSGHIGLNSAFTGGCLELGETVDLIQIPFWVAKAIESTCPSWTSLIAVFMAASWALARCFLPSLLVSMGCFWLHYLYPPSTPPGRNSGLAGTIPACCSVSLSKRRSCCHWDMWKAAREELWSPDPEQDASRIGGGGLNGKRFTQALGFLEGFAVWSRTSALWLELHSWTRNEFQHRCHGHVSTLPCARRSSSRFLFWLSQC